MIKSKLDNDPVITDKYHLKYFVPLKSSRAPDFIELAQDLKIESLGALTMSRIKGSKIEIPKMMNFIENVLPETLDHLILKENNNAGIHFNKLYGWISSLLEKVTGCITIISYK